jgi:HSP20 family protein
MAKSELTVTRTSSIQDEIARRQEQIQQRAYDLFLGRGGVFGAALGDWLEAERELSGGPTIEVRQKDNRFEIDVVLPDVDPATLDVRVTARDVLIQAATGGGRRADGDAASAPNGDAQLFRAFHLPEPIDPDGVKANFKNGLLRLRAPIAKPPQQNVGVRV